MGAIGFVSLPRELVDNRGTERGKVQEDPVQANARDTHALHGKSRLSSLADGLLHLLAIVFKDSFFFLFEFLALL